MPPLFVDALAEVPPLFGDALTDERVGFAVRRRQIVDPPAVLPVDPEGERRQQGGDRGKVEQCVHAGIVARRRRRDQ